MNIGPATFTVKDVKLGRQMSTVHVTLSQGSREEVVAYFTNSNLHAENGISFSTGWELHPPASPVDIAALRAGKDERWEEQAHMPFAVFRKASQNVKFFFPKQGQPMRSIADQWMCFKNGDSFTNVDVGFVADMFPQVIESYRTGSDPYAIVPPNKAATEAETKSNGMASFWYPTVLLNLDIKKALPEEGAEFLFVRTRAKQIRNGRYDLEVIILDEGGEIVCLSHHVCMVLSAERNMAKRNTAQKL
ncbi:hypothetical protein M8818_005168 [Zalaria obscura]|uniref:Uncharacterized protein n=1 Tax=Zalaria obscura TaxID=2024903 RepID=A0ACC3SBE3_9PEZI